MEHTTEASTQGEPDSGKPVSRGLALRKIVFAVWALGFVALYAVVRLRMPGPPLRPCLIGTGVFWATAIAALWLLGSEPRRALRAWRAVFVAWAMLVMPTLLILVDGLSAQGWPSGSRNVWIARLLTMLLVVTAPAFLIGLGALLRAYRSASVLAVATGLAYLGDGIFLLRATWKAKGLRLQFENVLDIVLVSSQIASYAAIPIGVMLVVGGVLTFRAARRST